MENVYLASVLSVLVSGFIKHRADRWKLRKEQEKEKREILTNSIIRAKDLFNTIIESSENDAVLRKKREDALDSFRNCKIKANALFARDSKELEALNVIEKEALYLIANAGTFEELRKAKLAEFCVKLHEKKNTKLAIFGSALAKLEKVMQ